MKYKLCVICSNCLMIPFSLLNFKSHKNVYKYGPCLFTFIRQAVACSEQMLPSY